MVNMKKVGESWFPPWLTFIIIGTFAVGTGLLFLVLASPLIVTVLIYRLRSPRKIRELYREIRGHW